ncbi:MAG: hypothetical protein VXW25_05910, partial [Pseudomonadota bacterium]|nr:hypothetical protein [Pseudomonadota bacterium]
MTTHHWDNNTNHLTFHERFSAADFDAGYNLRARRPDFEQTVITAWQDGSEAARTRLDCELDRRYGSGKRQRLDVFRPLPARLHRQAHDPLTHDIDGFDPRVVGGHHFVG